MEQKKRIVITGITGIIGRQTAGVLNAAGYEVYGLSRSPTRDVKGLHEQINVVQWGVDGDTSWHRVFEGAFAVINLAGENIASGRWSKRRKELVLQSRLDGIAMCRQAIDSVSEKPQLFVHGSAIGYYGIHPGLVPDENGMVGDGFLASVCREVEQAVHQTINTRIAILRTGIVLSAKAGALPAITAPMRFGIGGYPGNGKQFLSWIHVHDAANAILHLLDYNKEVPVWNLTAPESVTMKELVRLAAKLKNAKIVLPVPAPALYLLNGKQMVDETLLASQQVIPRALLDSGFNYSFPDLKSALTDCFSG